MSRALLDTELRRHGLGPRSVVEPREKLELHVVPGGHDAAHRHLARRAPAEDAGRSGRLCAQRLPEGRDLELRPPRSGRLDEEREPRLPARGDRDPERVGLEVVTRSGLRLREARRPAEDETARDPSDLHLARLLESVHDRGLDVALVALDETRRDVHQDGERRLDQGDARGAREAAGARHEGLDAEIARDRDRDRDGRVRRRGRDEVGRERERPRARDERGVV